MMDEFDYQASYCEENVWHLAHHSQLLGGEVKVVFISNRNRRVAIWNQRVNDPSPDPVVWDYHVVIMRKKEGWEIWDLDCRLGMPLPLADYLRLCFGSLPQSMAPLFRVIDRDEFVTSFSSDRSHMKRGDYFLAPPPPWPAILDDSETMNLMKFVDMEKPYLGDVMDLEQIAALA